MTAAERYILMRAAPFSMSEDDALSICLANEILELVDVRGNPTEACHAVSRLALHMFGEG
jgi:hypothetical protein